MKLGDAKPPNPEKTTANDSEKQVTEQVKCIGSYLETLQYESQRLRDQNRYLQRSVHSYRDGHKSQCVNVLSFIFVVYALGYGACRFVDSAFSTWLDILLFCSVDIAMNTFSGILPK